MTHTLQILHVILFGIPILALLGIGTLILHRSVSIVNRRWFLVVFIPLLLSNILAFFAENGQLRTDWRTWLILGADLALILGAIWVACGFQVYGLSAEVIEKVITEVLHQQGFTVKAHSAEKRDIWGRARDARRLTAVNSDQTHIFWITERFNEVLIRAERASDTKILRLALPALRELKVVYEFKAHAVGVLYIVLALVFAVLTWIFFFEPRLILPE